MTLDDLSTALPLHCIAQVSDIIWFVHIDLEDDSGPVLSMVIPHHEPLQDVQF